MEKIRKLIILLLFSVLFIPYVNASGDKCTYKGTPAAPNVKEPAGTEVCSVNTANLPSNIMPVVTPLGTSKGLKIKEFSYLGRNEKDEKVYVGSANFVYYQNSDGLSSKKVTISGGDLAYITLPKAVYYYDSTDQPVYFDVKVTLTSLVLHPFNKNGCKNDSNRGRYAYAAFSYRSNRVMTSSRIMYDSKEVAGDKDCAANFETTYRVDVIGAPNNMHFLWRFTDIDQPDKTGSGNSYSGKYTEAVVFNSGFWGSGTISAGSGLKVSGQKYIATCSSNKDVDPNNYLTSVWRYQSGTSASITWIGTRGVETSITGNGTGCKHPDPPKHVCTEYGGNYFNKKGEVVPYLTFKADCTEYDYDGDYCDSGEEYVDAACDNNDKVISDNGDTRGTDEIKDQTFASNKHTSCKMGDTVEVGEYYFNDPTNGTIIVNNQTSGSCVKVKLSAPIVLTENITLNVGNLYNLHKNYIYAGGGFGWNGAKLTNSVSWLWRYRRSEKDSKKTKQKTFYLAFNHKVNIMSGGVNTGLETPNDYYTLDDVTLYTDSSCKTKLTYEKIDEEIAKQLINVNYINGDIEFNKKFMASTDSNDADSGTAVLPLNRGADEPIIVNDNNTPVVVEQNKSDLLKTITNSVSMKKAYIDRRTAEVTYDDPTDDMIDAGSLYYVPLKYTDDVFSIYFGNAGNKYAGNSFSVIGQNNKHFILKCDVLIKHIFYEKDKKSGRLKNAFRYRPIKVNDTFNGESKEKIAEHAQNWAQWYCDANGNCGNTTNRGRIENTYDGCSNTNESGKCNNPLYRISFDSDAISNIRRVSNGLAYNDFSSIYVNGTSSFVTEKNGFEIVASNESYCNLGGFNASKCDKKRSGGS